MMDRTSGEVTEVAALGRPFSLGMMYDCRSDLLIPGMTLWDLSDLKEGIAERPQTYNDFEIVASESIKDKSSALNVDASLKASFLGGLVQVDGSAKYLNDSKASKNQARVTLKYRATTKIQELSMNHLGRRNLKHPYVFGKGLATHVVTAILYGAHAFFVFDREVSEHEDHQDVHCNMKVIIKKIPLLSIEGEGSLSLTQEEKEKADKLSCKFYVDFCLLKSPANFQDAVQVYQKLPGLLEENAVPMKVWLLALTCLESSAAKIVRQISIGLVQEAQRVLEDFSELEMRYNDVLRTTTAHQFPQIGEKIKSLKEMCSEFKQVFQQTLAKKLPSIRGGREKDAELAEILKKRHFSPFSCKKLNEWMDCKEREIRILKSVTKNMTNTKIISSQNDLYNESLSAEHVVCFVFTSLGKDEPYLSDLSKFLKGTNKQNPQVTLFNFIFNSCCHSFQTHDVEKKQWCTSKEVTGEMRKKAKLFGDFAEANKENKNIKFLTVGLTNETQEGSCIYLYEDGFPVSENFEPPSMPETVTAADINHNSVTLKISPPTFGAQNITSYSVEYSVSGEDEWQQKTKAKAEEVTVSDLKTNTEYVFRCRAVTSAGVGPANQVSIKTLPCSPPGKPQVTPKSTEISVSWKKPAELGEDVQILSYIVEYARTDDIEEALQWNQTESSGEKVIVSGLQVETEYAVRVRCDCGSAGRSKESITVKVCIEAHLVEILRRTSKMVKSDSPSVYKLPLTEEHMNIDGCRKFNFGKESARQTRTIMLLGGTGSGKSTLIDGMINYIVGVKWEDSFRFKLINEDQSKSQAYSQTSEVTVYKINHQDGFKIPFSLTIVDTPGFGDTRGIERDREITEQLRNLFSSPHGATEIDAVCFVAQASLARLTPTQKYVFDSVLSIFGSDVAENIRILVTFADGQQPPVLDAISVSEVPCPKAEDGLPAHFKFNNSALFAENKSSEGDNRSDDDEKEITFEQMFWDMGTKSMQLFFAALNLIETKSLTLTKEVLRERKQLETLVENLQKQYKLGLAKMEEIKETREKLKEHEAEINRNENFEIEVTVMKPFQKDISGTGNYITNCQQCHFTCHYPCEIPNDADKRSCKAMGLDGHCTLCPHKCYWNVHFNQKYSWEYKELKEKKTVKELKEKYQSAKGEKMNVQGLVDKLQADHKNLQAKVVKLVEKSSKCLNRLKEISLKTNPLSTPEYIDILIEGEKSEAKSGWMERVKALMEMKEKAEIMAKIQK